MTQLPGSGFVLETIFSDHLEFRGAADKDLPADTGDITVGWDWRFADDDFIEVSFSLGREPTRDRPEFVQASHIGVFRVMPGDNTIPLEQFVKIHAPALLMSYAREAISNLTSRGAYGPLFLPPVNIVALMARFDIESTQGIRQLREKEHVDDLQPTDK